MSEKYRGEIPFFLKNKKNSVIYVCSSNKNIEEYYEVLKKIYKNKLIKVYKEDIEEVNNQKFNIKKIIESSEKFIILISLNMFLDNYFEMKEKIILEKSKNSNINLFLNQLENSDLEKVYLIEKRNQYSKRGDIIDIFTKEAENPIRIEYFGDEIDRITIFDLETQKSIEKLEKSEIYLKPNENILNIFDIITQNREKISVIYENEEILNYKLEEQILYENIDITIDYNLAESNLRKRYEELLQKGNKIDIINFSEEEIKSFSNYDKIKKISYDKKVKIYTTEKQKYIEIFKKYKIDIIDMKEIPLYGGYQNEKELILTDRELKGVLLRHKTRENQRLKYKTHFQLKENEYIIHKNHGVGIYKGIENINGIDHLKLKYADEDMLFLPIDGINKIEKYISTSGETPSIYNLGRKGFNRKKEKLQEELIKFAKEIIEVQAKREKGKGFKFSEDTTWQGNFEDGFMYQETIDQLKAIYDVKNDMESYKIMDRLICGDVGFGKTEVAMRAAFKAAYDEKQVVLLVPTTVLAEQHYNRFKERFLNFPMEIEVISRLKTGKTLDSVIEKIKKGSIDIVIGTHRILSEDIKFKNLGLVIIDEEQKFGVKSKEKLKKLKENVDVLTLSATPIPRTLNLSLLGIRDISIIETSPEGRLPIESKFIESKEDIKKAIMFEIAREGQIFYVYNSVKNIENKVYELKQILPKHINIDYIHGQMPASQIKNKLKDFEDNNIDLLVCTVIIENGIDIENANTMIIEGSEKLGLSQVYQLKGRIGRGKRKAFCYLISNEHKSKKAIKREETLKNSAITTGIQISMEDMKIRGAGEILGEKQHGSIETFGYNLYIKMLKEEIEKIKRGETLNIEEKTDEIDRSEYPIIKIKTLKFIPDYYMEGIEKISFYKRAIELENLEDLQSLKTEIIDRFGKLPEEAEGFFEYLKIKISAKILGVLEIEELSDIELKTNRKKETEKQYSIKLDPKRVNIEKVIEMIKNNQIEYLKYNKTIIYKGNIFNFFTKYTVQV